MPPAAASPAAVRTPTLPRTMRALVKSKAAPGLTLVTDRPLPAGSTGIPGEPGPNDVLVRVHKVGVCGTDRHIYEWDDWAANRIPVGIVTGHEFVGVVERVGSAVEQVKPGDRVSAESHIAPGHDYNSLIGDAHVARNMRILGVDRDGIFADYAMIPQSHIWPVHDDIPDKWAAIFDPFGNAVHTVMSAGVSVKSVLITGAGIIGLMAVAVAKAAGAQQLFVAEPDPRRRALALKLGAHKAYNPLPKDTGGGGGGGGQGDDWVKEIKSSVQGEGVDVLLEMSGNPAAIVQGFKAMRQGGTAALLGIPSKSFNFDITEHIIFKGALVHGINGRQMWQTWFQMERLLLAGAVNLDDIITHELPFEDYNRAFQLMQTGEGIKIVLDLNGPTR